MSNLRLGTYNVLIPRTDTEGKGLSSWLARRESIIETIENEFDFVGLQECSFNAAHLQGQYIAEQLKELGWDSYLPYEDKLFKDEFHERLPIFWRRGVFTPEESGQLLLSSWTSKEIEEVPMLENRYASYVSGKLQDGRPILFVTLHLQHTTAQPSAVELFLTEAKRLEAHMVLTDFLRARDKEEAVFVAGDFNSPKAPKTLIEHLTPAQNVGNLIRWEHNSFHDWDYPRTGKHLDQVYVSDELHFGELAIGESIASDHYPVVYRLPQV